MRHHLLDFCGVCEHEVRSASPQTGGFGASVDKRDHERRVARADGKEQFVQPCAGLGFGGRRQIADRAAELGDVVQHTMDPGA